MSYKIKKICCIGAGYVGGPTMAVIADKCPNLEIQVVDIDEEKIKKWNSEDLSLLPIYEPGLEKIIKKCRGKNLHFSTDLELHIASSDMIFISVNTPTKTKGIGAGQASDLRWIDASARQIAEFARGETIVVEKSTLPVKTALTIKKILEVPKAKNSSKKFTVLSNPEFLAEGSAIEDLNYPDRVLIGGDDPQAMDALIEIYSNWVEKDKILTTDLWSSELSKLIANAFLAQRISSINSISALCEETGADIMNVSKAIGSDKRIGDKFLNPGPGFGGSCFKKDIMNLVYICNHYGLSEVAEYWGKVVDINNWQQKRISNQIVEKLFGTISSKKIAILGFSFKANTNDTRESPSIYICKELIEEGGLLSIFDPKVDKKRIELDLGPELNKKDTNNINQGGWIFSNSIKESLSNADAVVIMTEWVEFTTIDWALFASTMRQPAWVFDTRSITNIKAAKKYGLNIWSVGNGEND